MVLIAVTAFAVALSTPFIILETENRHKALKELHQSDDIDSVHYRILK